MTPAERVAIGKEMERAQERLNAARTQLDLACDRWEKRPYDPENLEAVRQTSGFLDDAIAVAQEWDVPNAPPLTIRVGHFE